MRDIEEDLDRTHPDDNAWNRHIKPILRMNRLRNRRDTMKCIFIIDEVYKNARRRYEYMERLWHEKTQSR